MFDALLAFELFSRIRYAAVRSGKKYANGKIFTRHRIFGVSHLETRYSILCLVQYPTFCTSCSLLSKYLAEHLEEQRDQQILCCNLVCSFGWLFVLTRLEVLSTRTFVRFRIRVCMSDGPIAQDTIIVAFICTSWLISTAFALLLVVY